MPEGRDAVDGRVEVAIDGTVALSEAIPGHVAPSGLWGFTAATGETFELHRVSQVTMTLPRLAACP